MTQTGDADPFNYLMGRKTSAGPERTEAPKVIRGAIKTFCDLHRSLQFERKDTRLALSYEPLDEPTLVEVKCDIDFMERIAFPGFLGSDFLSVWILHGQARADAVRKDVHGVWLRQDLMTGMSYNPYYHRADKARFDKAKQLINLVRGYEEPAAPEHCRFFGYTCKGSKAHEVELVVKKIFEHERIESREELAWALQARGYSVKRRKNGTLLGRKGITVTTPQGYEVRLIGSPLSPIKPRLVSSSAETRFAQIEQLIELNTMCLVVAERNWKRYRAKISTQTFEEAAKEGFGFEPIQLHQLIPSEPYEKPKRRNRPPLVRVTKRTQGGTPAVAPAAGSRGSQSGSPRSTHSIAGASVDIAAEHADLETGRRLAEELERGSELVRKIRQVVIDKTRMRRQAKDKRPPER